MKTQTIQFMRGLVLLPFLSSASPFSMPETTSTPMVAREASSYVVLAEERARKIDQYFAKRDMPLEGYGAIMVEYAFKNNLDWRLLPAIAVKESSGGRFACGKNPFGWGSCKISFKTWEDAIATVAFNLGGNNPATRQYYKDKTTKEKLHHYNGSVVPTYTGEIIEFMKLIEDEA